MSSAAAFAASQAITDGEWDKSLFPLLLAIKDRMELINHDKKPARSLPAGQIWVWMGGPGTPHWEVVGTGALPPEGYVPRVPHVSPPTASGKE